MVATRLAHDKAWPAPAKLNRFLHIIGRRNDGYHQLQTIFQFLDYGDSLWFETRADGLLKRTSALPGISAQYDIILRAAQLLKTHTTAALGATIHIEKQIPIGAGLGGGSSNAATTLLALNHYWQTGLSVCELAQLALSLGADVPVFVHGQAAWAEGIGEILTPIELDQPWFLVLIPPCQVATATVFNDPDLTRDSKPITMRALAKSIDILPGNDCEAVVFKRYPDVAIAFEWLSQYAPTRLTGTGACLFAMFAKRHDAERVLALKPARYSGFVSCGRNQSRLQECL